MKTRYFIISMAFILSYLTCSAQQVSLVRDIFPGPNSSYVIYNTLLNGKAVFSANETPLNSQPWVTDGTEAGTFMLKQVNPGGSAVIGPMVEMNGQVFFTADDGTNGAELWVTDGTAAGTKMLKDIFPGSQGSMPSNFAVLGDWLIFAATTLENGRELWKTNGQAAGTMLIMDYWEGPNSLGPNFLTTAGDHVYFTAEFLEGVFRTNGVASGTEFLNMIPATGGIYEPEFTLFEDMVYFVGTESEYGTQLWRINNSTVERVTDIVDTHADLEPANLTVVGDKLFFTGEQYPYGVELWAYSDGQAYMVKDINTIGNAYIGMMVAFKDKLVFSAYSPAEGVELWVSDGTSEGTHFLHDIYLGPLSSGIASPKVIDDILYFSATFLAEIIEDHEIWKLGDPEGSPIPFTQVPEGGANSAEMIKLNSSTFLFNGSDAGHGTELWKYTFSGSGIIETVKGKFVIQPNPVKGDFRIICYTFPGNNKSLFIYDITGQIVYSSIVDSDEVILNTDDLNLIDGLYLITIDDGSYRYSEKLIVIR